VDHSKWSDGYSLRVALVAPVATAAIASWPPVAVLAPAPAPAAPAAFPVGLDVDDQGLASVEPPLNPGANHLLQSLKRCSTPTDEDAHVLAEDLDVDGAAGDARVDLAGQTHALDDAPDDIGADPRGLLLLLAEGQTLFGLRV
jgi:hypothetical protein